MAKRTQMQSGLMVLGRRIDTLSDFLRLGDLDGALFAAQQVESTALKLAGLRGRHYDLPAVSDEGAA